MIGTALLLWALSQSAPAVEPALPPSTVALVVAYADGRVNYELTSAKPAWSWTPYFPRVKDWQQPEGALPVKAVQIDRVLADGGIRVEVSVLVGTVRDRQPVEALLIRPGSHVLVTRLREFGVEPVDLSLAEAAPMTPYLPTVFSATPNLEITSVELMNAPYPGYRITVRNLSDKAAANFHVQSYRGGEKALSGLPRGPEGRPVMTPGGTHTFELKLTSGGKHTAGVWSPTPLDVIEIESVLWADGSSDGMPVNPSTWIAPDAGRRLQLTRINDILRKALDSPDAGGNLLTAIRSRIRALPDQDEAQLPLAQRSMRSAKVEALRDVTRFEQDSSTAHDPAANARWVRYTIERYERWIAHLAQ